MYEISASEIERNCKQTFTKAVFRNTMKDFLPMTSCVYPVNLNRIYNRFFLQCYYFHYYEENNHSIEELGHETLLR